VGLVVKSCRDCDSKGQLGSLRVLKVECLIRKIVCMQCFAVNFGFKPGELAKVANMGKPQDRTLGEHQSATHVKVGMV
jgi:hypothetical protein